MPNEKILIKPGQLTDSTEINILTNCILQRRIITRIYVTNCMIKIIFRVKNGGLSLNHSWVKIQIQQFHLSVMEIMLLILTVKRQLLLIIFFLCNSELEDTNANAPPYSHELGPILSNITATTHDVLVILKSLDTNKATGADGISPKMLKEAAPAIAESLTKLINMSLDCKIFPKSWKLANVLPLFQKND